MDSPCKGFNGQWYGWHFAHNRNRDGNLYVRYLIWNGDRWNSNFNWLDNDWNDNNPAAVDATFFISHPASAGSSFRELSIPATEHLSYFIQHF